MARWVFALGAAATLASAGCDEQPPASDPAGAGAGGTVAGAGAGAGRADAGGGAAGSGGGPEDVHVVSVTRR